MKTNILVVEDDNAIRNLLTTALSAFGYKFCYASNGAEAIKTAVSTQPDLFIIDLGLPDMDGTELIRKLRTWTNNPIIVLSARNEISDKIQALDTGAEDYLTKPFNVEELMARIRAAIRKINYNNKSSNIFTNGKLRIDYAANCAFIDNVEIHLTPMEYKLLWLLSRNVGKILTYNNILKELWLSDFHGDTQSLRVCMATLRKKIEENSSKPLYLQTHVGIGYRMVRISDDNT
ncbi:response regulator transcription factor [Selenomonadales bacterium OttesenSCG-928-I06]|nr:response regulator transcription factor [Selenomonadales bacterium OttesenSCG-928-I06]